MKYQNIVEGRFLSRPNRFIANVLINGREEICHVKNTGRCRELLQPGAAVYLEHVPSDKRRTNWDLIAVMKGDRLINMDAQAPNRIFREFAETAAPPFGEVRILRPEKTFGQSRFDFYFERPEGHAGFVEVKGVTLEKDGVVSFPDAPTERGVKHLEELIHCHDAGFEAWLCFVIQMQGVRWFEPASVIHPQFAETLYRCKEKGVHILAIDCLVKPDEVIANMPVEIHL